MTTIRVARRHRDFTQIQNSALRDERLSFRARGVLAWLLSHSDGWRVDSTAIARASAREGREAVRTALRELEDAGYLRREKVRGEDGRLSQIATIYETPAHASAQESDAGSADAGDSGAIRRPSSEDQVEDPHPPTREELASVGEPVAGTCSRGEEGISARERALWRLIRAEMDTDTRAGTFPALTDNQTIATVRALYHSPLAITDARDALRVAGTEAATGTDFVDGLIEALTDRFGDHATDWPHLDTRVPTATKRDEMRLLKEALLSACAIDAAEVTASANAAYNKAATHLRKVNATPEQIAERAANYHAHWPDATLTPTALARHWSELDKAAVA